MLTLLILLNCIAIISFVVANVVITRLTFSRADTNLLSIKQLNDNIQLLSKKFDTHRGINADYAKVLEMGGDALDDTAKRTQEPEDIERAAQAQDIIIEHDRKQKAGAAILNTKITDGK